MAMKTTYTQARANLAALWDEVTSNREIVIIQRRGAEDVALISLEELTGLLETVHLIKSPTNADRLLTAYGRAMKGEGISRTVAELRESFGLD